MSKWNTGYKRACFGAVLRFHPNHAAQDEFRLCDHSRVCGNRMTKLLSNRADKAIIFVALIR